MILYKFNSLTLEEKQATTWKHGIFLENYITEDIRIGCCAIDKFFVEVEWNIENDNIIGKGEFKCGTTLNRYSNVPNQF